jgi:signal peptidase
MTVVGTSMEPTITSSDIIVVTPVDRDLAVGDIISYRYQFEDMQYTSIVTHRIVGLENGGYRTKGDAYTKADVYIVAPEDVIGIMHFRIPYIGLLVQFANTAIGLVATVIAPAVIIITLEIRNILRQWKGA